MKIYTKGGDAGQTGLFGGARVSKDDLRIQAYGALDELNACLGLALAEANVPEPEKGWILRVQGELFQLGAELATPHDKKTTTAMIGSQHIERLEKEIDQMDAQLAPLKTFILPGGTRLSALLHLARTICRRAERELVTSHREDPARPEVLQYVNRLSDYLFVTARRANHAAEMSDVPWLAPSVSRVGL